MEEQIAPSGDQEFLELVNQLVERALKERHPKKIFEPGVSHVPVSGKFFGAPEITAAVQASLDFWLTAGPSTENFERRLAKYLGVRSAAMVNSGLIH